MGAAARSNDKVTGCSTEGFCNFLLMGNTGRDPLIMIKIPIQNVEK